MTPAIIPQQRQPSRYVRRLHLVSRSVQSVEAQIVMKLRRARVCGSRLVPSTSAPHLLPCPLQLSRALREKASPTPEANGHAAKPRLLLNHNHDINSNGGFMYPAAPKRASSDQTHNRHNMSVEIKPREPPLVAVDARDNDCPSASATRQGDVERVGRETGEVSRRQDDDTGDTSTDGLGLLSKRPLDSGVHLTKWRRRAVRGEKVLRQLGRTRESMDIGIEEKRLQMARDLVRRLTAEKKGLLVPTAAKTEKERTTTTAATGSAAISARGEEACEKTRGCDKQGKPSRTPVRRVPWRTGRSKSKIPSEEKERAKKRAFPARQVYVASTAAAMPTLYPRVFDGNRVHRRASRCSHTPCSGGDPAGPLEKQSSPSMPRQSYPPPWNAGLTAGLGVGPQMRATQGGGIRRSHARHATGNTRFGPYNVRDGEEAVSEPWIRDWECPSCGCDSHPDLGSIAPDDGEWFPACTLSDAGRQQKDDGIDDSEAQGCWLGRGGALSRRTPLRPPSRRGPRPARHLTPPCGQCRHCGVPMGRRVDQVQGRNTAHKSQKGAWHRHARWREGGAEDKSPRRARKPSATRRFAGRPPEPRQRREKRPRWNSRFWVPEQMAAAPRPAVNQCGSSQTADCAEPAQVAGTRGAVRATVHPCDCPSQADDVGARLAQIKQEHALHEIGRVYAHEIGDDNEYQERDDDSLTVVLTEESELDISSNDGRRGLEMIVSELSTTMFSREPPQRPERRGGSLGNTHHGQGESPRPEGVLPRIFGDTYNRDDSDVGMQGRESDNGGVPASRGLLLEFMWPSTPRSAYCVVCTEAATAVAPPGREWPSWSAHHPQCIGERKAGRGNSGALVAEESGKALASRRPALPMVTRRTERSQSSHSTTLTRSIDSPLLRSNRCCSANYLVLTLGFLRHMVEIFLAGGGENHHPKKAAGVTASGGDQGLRNQRRASPSHSTLWSDTRAALGRIHAFSTFGAEGRGINRSDTIQGRLLDAMAPTDLCRGLVPLIVRAFRPPQNFFRRRKRDGSGALCDDGLEFGVFLGWAVRKQLQLPSGRPRRDVGARVTAVDIFRRLYKYESGCDGNEGSGANGKGQLSTSTTGGGKFHRWITPESTVSTTQSDASSDSRQATSNPTDDASSADAFDRSYNISTRSTTFITEDADLSLSYAAVGGSASAETLSSLGTWGVSTEAGGSVTSSLGNTSGVSDVHPEANEMSTLSIVSGGNGLGRAPRVDSCPYPCGLNLRILAEMQRANPHVRFPGLAEAARMFADELARLAEGSGGAAADG